MSKLKRVSSPWFYVPVLVLVGACLLPLRSAPAGDEPAGGDSGQLNKAEAEKLLGKKSYSPYAGRKFPTRPFFGDTHLHTSASMDAGAFGNRLDREQAYRFCRGEEVRSSTGQAVKLSRPLDFVVIADHSDGMGFFTKISSGDPTFMADSHGKRWNKMINEGDGVNAALELIGMFSQGTLPWATNDPKMMKPIWHDVIADAERFNEPGRFTAFIGYEWTSLIKGNNLHRVVIYRDDGDMAKRTLPYTNADSSDPEKLWAELSRYEEKTGGSVLAIPHNGNLSNGMMFQTTTIPGQAFDKDYCDRRARFEVLYEATQIKGDGEAHPLLSPDDEFADYETWAFGNLDLSAKKTPDMLPGEYVRSGLKRGLELEAKLGANPFKFGLVGSTDSHTSLPAVEEENFFGKHAGGEPSPERWSHAFMKNENGTIAGWQETSSGFAAVWATENTRAAIFDAMMRRETYATTGTRMAVRMFGGWDFEAKHAHTRNPAVIGYQMGVPMGGDLRDAPEGKAPTFLVAALRDPIGANLDRIQIVKGWLGADGKAQEKVYDVVWGDADKRSPDAQGKLPPVGNTVDVAAATWTNTIGDPELIGVWKDPSFDPKQKAFYYVRVLEIPTPRWTAYDAKRFGVKMGPEVEMVTQERGYTSPIWYTPTR